MRIKIEPDGFQSLLRSQIFIVISHKLYWSVLEYMIFFLNVSLSEFVKTTYLKFYYFWNIPYLKWKEIYILVS